MSIGLYMDVHIPLAITEGRRRRGIDVLTAQQDGADRLEDELLLQRATRLDRALFSQDEDLWSFWVYCGSSEKEMHRVRLSPQDFLRHLAGVQVVIDHELEVGVPTLIGTLAEWLRQLAAVFAKRDPWTPARCLRKSRGASRA